MSSNEYKNTQKAITWLNKMLIPKLQAQVTRFLPCWEQASSPHLVVTVFSAFYVDVVQLHDWVASFLKLWYKLLYTLEIILCLTSFVHAVRFLDVGY